MASGDKEKDMSQPMVYGHHHEHNGMATILATTHSTTAGETTIGRYGYGNGNRRLNNHRMNKDLQLFKIRGFVFHRNGQLFSENALNAMATLGTGWDHFGHASVLYHSLTAIFHLCYFYGPDYIAAGDDYGMKLNFFHRKVVPKASRLVRETFRAPVMMELVETYSKARREFLKRNRVETHPVSRNTEDEQMKDKQVKDEQVKDEQVKDEQEKSEKPDGKPDATTAKPVSKRVARKIQNVAEERERLYQTVDQWNDWIDEQKGHAINTTLFQNMGL
ncbi:hypothetical protein F4818DRAFT_380507 [Hypoxylon cercidicola]|nr:hypothetical protein F4818DRAFT_380507 [Hypoxylon cercidicola]